MKVFKIVLLTLVLTVGFILPSCDDSLIDCDCSGIEPYFDIKDLKIQNNLTDSDWYSPDLEERDSISFEAYEGINLDYIVDYHSSIDWNFSLINSVAACSCLPSGHSGSTTEKIEKLEVITLNDFDDEHLAGSIINDLLTITFLGRFDSANKKSLDDFLAEQTSFIEMEDLPLSLEKAPEINSIFHVKVILQLSTGETYEAENRAIKLLE